MEDDGDDKDDTKRRTRNLSEKKRRDQFNMLVNELGSMVSTNNRKMDKSTVLKSTISFLKNHNEVTVRSRVHDVQEDWKPAFLSNEEFTYLVLEALEGFVMVFSITGRIYYVSEGVTSLLGHNPADVVNKSIFDFTYEEDQPNLYNLLHRNGTTGQIQTITKDKEVIKFQVHIRRGAPEESTYELIEFYGHFRHSMEHQEQDHDMMGYQQETESRVLFVCAGRLYTPQLIRDVSLVDNSRSEFTSRHSLEWKFLFLDHRAPPIIGYLPFEVLGTSGYDYYHFDDLEKVVTCHEALMQKGELTSCYYRFLTKGQQWIWLQTRFYITYHQWNSKPEFVVCTHRVVSYADIVKSAKEECVEADTVSEAEVNRGGVKETQPDETMLAMSPSYMSEASDAFAASYQPISQMHHTHSQPASVKSASAGSTAGTIGTVATADASWSRASQHRYTAGSDTLSISSEPRSNQRNSRENYRVARTTFPWPRTTIPTLRAVPTVDMFAADPRFGVRPETLIEISDDDCEEYKVTASRLHPWRRSFIPTLPIVPTVNMYTAGPRYAVRSGSPIEISDDDEIEDTVTPSTSSRWTHTSVQSVSFARTVPSVNMNASEPRHGTCADTLVDLRDMLDDNFEWPEACGTCMGQEDNVMMLTQLKGPETPLAPQHGMGTQFLDPSPYVGAVSVPGVLPLPLQTVPVIVTSDQAQIQEQLQRKHEELQQMIVRQQEELRQVKEQLLLARLGMLQPIINVNNPYPTPEEIQHSPQPRLPAPITYDANVPRTVPGYPQLPHPPHPENGSHQHMPQ